MIRKILNALKGETADTSHAAAVGSSSAKYKHSTNEHNPILQGPSGITVYDKMRRQDEVIKSIISVINSPLKGAAWTIRSQSENPKDQEIAQFFYSYFWEKSPAVFNLFLSNCLTMIPFGFSVFEKVWTLQNIEGKSYMLIDAQFRPQITITDIDADSAVLKQSVKGNEYSINFENLVFFVLDQEGKDYWGNSILRPCYHSYIQKLEQYDNLAVAGNRIASGFLRVTYDDKVKKGSKEYSEIEEAARLIASNRMQAFLATKNIETSYETPNISSDFYINTIDKLDNNIRQAALANFISLGSGNTGSYSVGEVQYNLFLKALKSITNILEQTFNKEFLRPMVDANFGPQKNYPELICQDLDRDAAAARMAIALQYFNSGVLVKTEQDDVAIRYNLGLGEGDTNEQQPAKKENPPKTQPDNLKAVKETSWGKSVDLYATDLERFMRGQLIVLQDKITYKVRRHLENKGAAGMADMLDDISFSDYKTKLTRKISWLCAKGWFNAEQYTKKNSPQAAKKIKPKEFDEEIPDEDYGDMPGDIRPYISNKANVLIGDQKQQIKNNIMFVLTNNINSGMSIDNIMAKIGSDLDAYVAGNNIAAAAEIAVVEAINTAENAYYKNEVEEGGIAYFVYELGHAKEHTGYCLELEGRAFTPWGSAFTQIFPPKHFGCTGHLVPVFWYEGIEIPKNIDDLSGVDLNFQQF